MSDEGAMFFSAGIRKDEDAVVCCENEGATSYRAGILKDKDAVVFWDAQDYPISGVDHESVFLKIKETLSVCPKVSIHSYVSKNKLSDELRHKYEDAQIIIHDLSRGEKANWQILVDIYMWEMRCDGRSNLFVLSNHFTEVEMIGKLMTLHAKGYGVFFSETGREHGGHLPSNSFLTKLFTKKRGREADTLDDHDLTLKSQTNSFSISNSIQSMTGDFPSVPHCQYSLANTCIYLVMDDLSILDDGQDGLLLRKKLDQALGKKGYFGSSVYWGHFINTKQDDDLNYNWRLESVEYNEGAGFDKVLAEILNMVMIYKLDSLNLLILSNNEKFRQGTRRLAEVSRFLKKNFLWNVVIAQIDQLLQVVDQSGMEADELLNFVTQLPPP